MPTKSDRSVAYIWVTTGTYLSTIDYASFIHSTGLSASAHKDREERDYTMASMIIVMISTSSFATHQSRRTKTLTIYCRRLGRLASRQDGVPRFVLLSVRILISGAYLLLAVVAQIVGR